MLKEVPSLNLQHQAPGVPPGPPFLRHWYHSTGDIEKRPWFVLLVGCLSSQQHASVSQGRICTDNFTCCHTEIEAADPTFHLTQSQYTDKAAMDSPALVEGTPYHLHRTTYTLTFLPHLFHLTIYNLTFTPCLLHFTICNFPFTHYILHLTT